MALIPYLSLNSGQHIGVELDEPNNSWQPASGREHENEFESTIGVQQLQP